MITACLTTLAFMVSSLHLAPEERVVRVSVEFKTADGVALDDLPVAGRTFFGTWRGFTDTQGRFEAEVRVGKDERVMMVRPAPIFPLDPGTSNRAQRQARLNERFTQYAFQRTYEVAIEGDTAASTIVVHPAGRAIIRVRDSDGKDVRGVYWGHQSPIFNKPLVPDGVAEITGLPIPGPTTVHFLANGLMFYFDVTCPNQDVVDLGVVDVPAVRECVRVRVRRHGLSIFDARYEIDGAGLSLLRLDPQMEKPRSDAWGWGWGWSLITEGLDPTAPKGVQAYKGWALPGRYVLVPTSVGLTRLGNRVLEAWRAGEDLHAKWGLPIVEVTAEGPNEFEVSTEAIYKAVMGELPPTIDDRANALVEPGPAPTPTKNPAPEPGVR